MSSKSFNMFIYKLRELEAIFKTLSNPERVEGLKSLSSLHQGLTDLISKQSRSSIVTTDPVTVHDEYQTSEGRRGTVTTDPATVHDESQTSEESTINCSYHKDSEVQEGSCDDGGSIASFSDQPRKKAKLQELGREHKVEVVQSKSGRSNPRKRKQTYPKRAQRESKSHGTQSPYDVGLSESTPARRMSTRVRKNTKWKYGDDSDYVPTDTEIQEVPKEEQDEDFPVPVASKPRSKGMKGGSKSEVSRKSHDSLKLLTKSSPKDKDGTVKRGISDRRKLFKCNKCTETFTRLQSLIVHVNSHGDAPVSCRFCRSVFTSRELMKNHECCPPKIKSKFTKTCKMCGKKFQKYSHFLAHYKVSHSKERAKWQTEVTCRHCGARFYRKHLLYKHYQQQHAKGELVCMCCGEYFKDRTSYEEHIKTHKESANFVCMKCGMKYHSGKYYDRHYRLHKVVDCNLCSYSAQIWEDLASHYENAHGRPLKAEELTYNCTECNKQFSRRSLLEVHKEKHSKEKPIECKPCQLVFTSIKSLYVHKMTYRHSLRADGAVKEKTFLCSECGKAYFRKHALQRHMTYHSGTKPHVCQYCGYKCRESNNLKRHISLHFEAERNFVCEVCGAAFHAKKTLEMHMSYKHNDIRAFACDQCDLTFKAKNALSRHIKVHSNEKDHRCWCGTAFKRLYNLRRHVRTVHGRDDFLPPVRRVRTLDKPTKTPVSRTDLSNSVAPVSRSGNQVDRRTNYTNQTSGIDVTTTETDAAVASCNMTTSVSEESTVLPHLATSTVTNTNHHSERATYPILSSYLMSEQEKSHTNTPLHMSGVHLDQHFPGRQIPPPATMTTPHGQATSLNLQEPHTLHTLPSDPHVNNPLSASESTRVRYPSVDNLYSNMPLPTTSHALDPSDPFNVQGGGSMSGSSANFIPQAVAYSTILRELGSQLQFLQDTSVNTSVIHNYCKPL